MSNHTPEPWVYSFPKINGEYFRETDCQISTGGSLIANVSHGPIFPSEPFDSQVREANARRIVACVNACAGMEDPSEDIAKLKHQRDELLSALHDATTSLETIQLRSFGADSCLDDKHSMRAYAGSRASVARAAIAKAKGCAA